MWFWEGGKKLSRKNICSYSINNEVVRNMQEKYCVFFTDFAFLYHKKEVILQSHFKHIEEKLNHHYINNLFVIPS